jgi:hypothetical protein
LENEGSEDPDPEEMGLLQASTLTLVPEAEEDGSARSKEVEDSNTKSVNGHQEPPVPEEERLSKMENREIFESTTKE